MILDHWQNCGLYVLVSLLCRIVAVNVTPQTGQTQYDNSCSSSSLDVHTRSAFLCASQQVILLLCSLVITRWADLYHLCRPVCFCVGGCVCVFVSLVLCFDTTDKYVEQERNLKNTITNSSNTISNKYSGWADFETSSCEGKNLQNWNSRRTVGRGAGKLKGWANMGCIFYHL